jgi:transposase-like protein
MALVPARPGVTVREAGAEFGVDPTSLYRIVHRLEQRGELRKNGRALEPTQSGGPQPARRGESPP